MITLKERIKKSEQGSKNINCLFYEIRPIVEGLFKCKVNITLDQYTGRLLHLTNEQGKSMISIDPSGDWQPKMYPALDMPVDQREKLISLLKGYAIVMVK